MGQNKIFIKHASSYILPSHRHEIANSLLPSIFQAALSVYVGWYLQYGLAVKGFYKTILTLNNAHLHINGLLSKYVANNFTSIKSKMSVSYTKSINVSQRHKKIGEVNFTGSIATLTKPTIEYKYILFMENLLKDLVLLSALIAESVKISLFRLKDLNN